MLKIVHLILLGLSLVASRLEADKVEHEFLSVISQEAATREWGKLSFSRLTVFNANTSTLTNALTVVALPRFEIGTSPLIYFEEGHKYNFSAKYNFYKSERWVWALAYGQMQYEFDVPGYGSFHYAQNALSLGFNYYSSLWDLYFSVFGAQNYAQILGDSLLIPYMKTNSEWGMDIGKRFGTRYFASLGVGQIREKGYTPFEATEWCAGLNLGVKFPEAFFSRPSAGFIYYPKIGSWGILFSTTFY